MNINHAATYLQLQNELDALRLGIGVPIYDHQRAADLRYSRGRPIPSPKLGQEYLITQLEDWYFRYANDVYGTRSGRFHFVMNRRGNDGRRQLPATICSALGRNALKVEGSG